MTPLEDILDEVREVLRKHGARLGLGLADDPSLYVLEEGQDPIDPEIEFRDYRRYHHSRE